MKKIIWIAGFTAAFFASGFSSCSKKDTTPGTNPVDTTTPPPPAAFDINSISDTYANVASYDNRFNWGPYNAHDPSIIKVGQWYYCFSTDASYGNVLPTPGIMIRKSQDLVKWYYIGQVF